MPDERYSLFWEITLPKKKGLFMFSSYAVAYKKVYELILTKV